MRRWSVPLGVFLASAAYFTLLAAPDLTWINTDSDGGIYLRAAKYMVLTHPTGAPIYNWANALALRLLPWGTEFWRLAMVSVVSSSVTAVLVYLSARHYRSRYAWLAPLVWLGSGLVVSQSTIVDAYAWTTMWMSLAFYLHLRGHPAKYAASALAVGSHFLSLFVVVPLLVSDWVNHRPRRPMLLTSLGALTYLYIPIVNRPPFLWIDGAALKDYAAYFMGQGGLNFAIAIVPPDNLITRLQDGVLVLVGGFGIAALVLLALAVRREMARRAYLLPFLVLLPVLHYLTNLAPQTYVYTLPSFAFGGILVARYAPRSWLTGAAVATAAVLMAANIQMYDIGRTLDPDLTARQYYRGLDAVVAETPEPVLWTANRGWERVVVWLYNDDHGTRIQTPYSYPRDDEESLAAQAVVDEAASRGTLYASEVTNPSTYGSRVVPAQRVEVKRWYWSERP